ncbi:uncharacterized protein JN550_002696 [Neoarthrinium moseri]|uniref:uncharacterized protein n=1 Tax=Neoarthrinium moseri TaxID=1658444 RepID=UPI001FDB5785|nr:uncharacterized protein JN550_002696 [Neoarthrinium moseri]KAI1874117.1 hypothetical protein JN550_002696 [Neoarthrinium moseri]
MAEPPSYAAANISDPRSQIHSAELPSFTLDKTLVFPSGPPAVAMYKVSRDPRDIQSHGSLEVGRLHYRLTSTGGEGNIRQSRTSDLYQILPSRTPHYLYIGQRTEVLLFGKGSRRATFEEATMIPGWGTGNWKIPGFFRVKRGLRSKMSAKGETRWLDWATRKVVAVEKKQDWPGYRRILPTLEIRVDLGDKSTNLLISCWVARLWRESE